MAIKILLDTSSYFKPGEQWINSMGATSYVYLILDYLVVQVICDKYFEEISRV